ncbi:MAG: ribulose-phosphate 3-epimerase [Acidimicrobiia bacterium]|nr:ribulose-phosphate 3-epimerase [Acidimicrobiia bacterium]MDH3396209.1 ribulose-phosphate 3-epimerase [Acidimicrobiia bacterium]MDH5616754.1 ribulose-phosphate 3-epimerase [Acidimicrobiia bacterium]
MKPARIAPSLLAADFARLGEDVQRIEPDVDMLHLDVMDGHFVPNISFGMPVIASLRAATTVYFDCHLMTTNPDVYLEDLKEAGADLVTVHIEVVPNPTNIARRAREIGLDFGLVISPSTPFAGVEPFVELTDLLLVMSVHPGFGGQSFMPEVLPRIEAARNYIDSHALSVDIEVDGGITAQTAPLARQAGAEVFVAGTAIFRDPDPRAAVRRLRDAIEAVE